MSKLKSRIPIWLDCDTGHDDALAILLAAHNPDVTLLGISTVHGNASISHTTYNTCAILKAIGREDVPVYAGASKPLERDAVYAPDIHGETGLDGTQSLPVPTVPQRNDKSAQQAIHDALINERKGSAWIVATGALTNIALLFEDFPYLADHVAGLSIMGGAVGGGFTSAPMGKVAGEGVRFGNWTPYAEFNMYCDPEAASTVLSNPNLTAKTTLIPLDLTHQFLATNEVQIGLLFGFGLKLRTETTIDTVSHVRRLYFEIISFFARTYADVFGITAGPPTHDPLAVAIVLWPYFFHCNLTGESDERHESQDERFSVHVVTNGAHSSLEHVRSGSSQCGRTVVKLLPPGEQGIRIPRGLESKEIWGLLEACLNRAELTVSRKKAPRTELPFSILDHRTSRLGTSSEHLYPLAGVTGTGATLAQLEAAAGMPVSPQNPSDYRSP